MTIAMGSISLISDSYDLGLFFEIFLCMRHISSILLALGVSHSVQQALEAEIRQRKCGQDLNESQSSLFETDTPFDPATVMRAETE